MVTVISADGERSTSCVADPKTMASVISADGESTSRVMDPKVLASS